MSQSETTQPATTAASQPDMSRVEWLEAQLGRTLPQELRDKVATQIANNDAAWQRGRRFPVPDGTEPSFIFRPVTPKP